MAELFADLPEAVQATVEIAHALRLAAADAQADPAALLRAARRRGRRGRRSCAARRRQASSGASPRTAPRRASPTQDYRERLAYESRVIERMKYPGYFLIVADFIQWAKEQDIPVGPGRGSGAGSLVA